MLQTVDRLPIPNKTMVQESRFSTTVERWLSADAPPPTAPADDSKGQRDASGLRGAGRLGRGSNSSVVSRTFDGTVAGRRGGGRQDEGKRGYPGKS